MVSGDLVLGGLFPPCATDEMLCLEERVAENGRVRGHCDELFSGHRLPDLVQERAVVDPQCRCNALAQTVPVLSIVSATKFNVRERRTLLS